MMSEHSSLLGFDCNWDTISMGIPFLLGFGCEQFWEQFRGSQKGLEYLD